MPRKFEVSPVKREPTPLLVGIIAPSGAGKTKSALRLADGMRRVTGGDVVVIDTENGRASQHAREHRFGHLKFSAPFGPLDYIEALRSAVEAGAKTIIIDSMSHEWEGEGGVLELHEAELDRMAGQDWKKREACNAAAWIRPKAAHLKFKHYLLQVPANVILCFRAKEKIKPERGKGMVDLGWQALGAADLTYEMLVRFLLAPGSDGVPTPMGAAGLTDAERAMVKVPAWFRQVLAQPKQLDEDFGELLARFASGDDIGQAVQGVPAVTPSSRAVRLIERLQLATPATLPEMETEARGLFRGLDQSGKDALRVAIESARARVAAIIEGEVAPMSEEEMAEIARMEAGK